MSAPGWDRRVASLVARGAFASLLGWIGLDMVVHATGPETLFFALDLPFRLMCHRLPERVLWIGDVPTPLCTRCLGIWLGLAVGAVAAWPVLSFRALKVVVPAALAVMIAELVTQDLGIHPVFHPTRVLTGFLVGLPIGGAVGGLIVRELGSKVSPPSSD